MKKGFVILICIFVTIPLFGQFRETTWGMSREKVIEIEGQPMEQEADAIVYTGEVAGLSALIGFLFIDDKLTSGGYVFPEPSIPTTTHFEDYEELDALLSSIYGEPVEQDTVWNNDSFMDDSSDYDFAISMGHMERYTIWKTDETEINHTLEGNDFQILHRIVYFSVNYEELRENKRKKGL